MAHVVVVFPGDNPKVITLPELLRYERPGLTLGLRQCNKGLQTIRSDTGLSLATPAIFHEVIEAEREGADAIVIDLMGDISLDACRELVDVPVVGLPKASMDLATTVGRTFSVVSTMSASEPFMRRAAAAYGYSDRLVSVRNVVLAPGSDYRSEESVRTLADCCRKTIMEDGADVVVFGSGRLFAVTDLLIEAMGPDVPRVPFVEPLAAGLAMAAALADAGLRNSRRAYLTLDETVHEWVRATADPVSGE